MTTASEWRNLGHSWHSAAAHATLLWLRRELGIPHPLMRRDISPELRALDALRHAGRCYAAARKCEP